MSESLTRFQKDIENSAVSVEYERLQLKDRLTECERQLREMKDACPWLDFNNVQERARKRCEDDEAVRSRGGLKV